MMQDKLRLATAARDFGTPLYAYDLDFIHNRFATLQQLFEGRFGISYAVKANPNKALLGGIKSHVATFDVSSFAEMQRVLAVGCPSEHVTFSGPAKRAQEIENAIALGLGELVVESIDEAQAASAFALKHGRKQDVLIRINPLRVPRNFGVNMAGKPSQFGIDEEAMESAITTIMALDGLSLIGFHIYSGTNSLKAEAIAENFEIFIDIFKRASAIAAIHPRKLIFGSGFGIPYLPDDTPLDMDTLATRVNPMMDAFLADPHFAKSQCILEMGRWLVGPGGWLLTSVISAKHSRGSDYRTCDAGFNNHLAACGMMGTVIRRNWIIENVSNPTGKTSGYTLVGPLCTTIDIIASHIELPELRQGDVVSIAQSGAYGLTASPTRFISHPEPREVLMSGNTMVDVTESHLNHWSGT